jgi:nucleoside-diphosphate-sugar epimerase
MFSITGGSGFVGSTLSARLAGHQMAFSILDRRDAPVFPERRVAYDICNIDDLRATLTGDTVIHLAAEQRDDVSPISRYQDVNVKRTENVAAVARETGINRIVLTSSVAVYGFAPTDTGEAGAINLFN